MHGGGVHTVKGMATYDLVLYGATGFTGKLVARYLSGVADLKGRRWAVAGRSEDKLRKLVASVPQQDRMDKLTVQLSDGVATERLVRSARAVINCAGPFSQCGGEALLGACARHGVHYSDLSGESWWQAEMVDKYHEEARRSGAKIILGGGVDSIPSDLGTMLALQALLGDADEDSQEEAHGQGQAQGVVSVVAMYTEYSGSISGGTLASGRAMARAKRGGHPYAAGESETDPYLLCGGGVTGADSQTGTADGMPLGFRWGLRWRQPFFMGAINARVVRRSLALRGIQGHVSYAECSAVSMWLRLAWVFLRSGLGYLRGAPIPLRPAPGQGPPPWLIREGAFAVHVEARRAAEDGGPSAHAKVVVRGRGDPGYGATAKMLAETGLCLALDPHRASHPDGGVLTPSTALGDLLVRRLRAAEDGAFMSLDVPSRPAR